MGGGIIIKDQQIQDFFQLLQYCRHDLINEVQLVQAYLSMDNYEKVREKMDEIIANIQKEQHLTSLQAPKFSFWILRFNHIHSNVKLTYEINTPRINLSSIDDNLINRCNQVIETIKKHLNKDELYHLFLEVRANDESEVNLKLQIKSLTKNDDLIDAILKIQPSASVYFDNEEITYEYMFSE